jgi:hypothetical protein
MKPLSHHLVINERIDDLVRRAAIDRLARTRGGHGPRRPIPRVRRED